MDPDRAAAWSPRLAAEWPSLDVRPILFQSLSVSVLAVLYPIAWRSLRSCKEFITPRKYSMYRLQRDAATLNSELRGYLDDTAGPTSEWFGLENHECMLHTSI